MALSKEEIQKIVLKYGKEEKNTGSVETQIALLTAEIKQITNHIINNKKDFSTKRGLFKKVSRRRSLLNYLMKKDIEKYRELVEKLGLRN